MTVTTNEAGLAANNKVGAGQTDNKAVPAKQLDRRGSSKLAAATTTKTTTRAPGNNEAQQQQQQKGGQPMTNGEGEESEAEMLAARSERLAKLKGKYKAEALACCVLFATSGSCRRPLAAGLAELAGSIWRRPALLRRRRLNFYWSRRRRRYRRALSACTCDDYYEAD